MQKLTTLWRSAFAPSSLLREAHWIKKAQCENETPALSSKEARRALCCKCNAPLGITSITALLHCSGLRQPRARCVPPSRSSFSRSAVVLSLSPGFRSLNLTQCSPLLVPRCAGVLLAPRHSPGDLRLLQHPGVSELVFYFFKKGNSEEEKEGEEEAGSKETARGERVK